MSIRVVEWCSAAHARLVHQQAVVAARQAGQEGHRVNLKWQDRAASHRLWGIRKWVKDGSFGLHGYKFTLNEIQLSDGDRCYEVHGSSWDYPLATIYSDGDKYSACNELVERDDNLYIAAGQVLCNII